MSRFDLAQRRELILKAAIEQGLLHPEDALVGGFIDLEGVARNVATLHQVFAEALPAGVPVLHAFAAKANSLIPVLAYLREQGMGCEVASEGEFAQAMAAGFAPEHIVFDSPAKTVRELRQALLCGAAINADNFQELERISALLRDQPSTSPIGIRINPQVGLGGIEAMSTAGATSKFGIPLDDEGNRQRLVEAYQSNPWLTRVHAHVGSQGCPLALITAGLERIVSFADEVNNTLGRQQITAIDIGGGLPVDFLSDNPRSDFAGYLAELQEIAPRLFSGDYQLVTEFGRTILAKFGFIAAYVEYTKTSGGQPIAITHAGAQTATRTVFMPQAWPIRIGAHDGQGEPKTGEPTAQDIAGPCCFAGDLLARDRQLPLLEPGDIVTLMDTGAYYFSTPFSYNSLLEPGVYGARIDAQERVHFTVMRHPQQMPELLERTAGQMLSTLNESTV